MLCVFYLSAVNIPLTTQYQAVSKQTLTMHRVAMSSCGRNEQACSSGWRVLTRALSTSSSSCSRSTPTSALLPRRPFTTPGSRKTTLLSSHQRPRPVILAVTLSLSLTLALAVALAVALMLAFFQGVFSWPQPNALEFQGCELPRWRQSGPF